MTSSEGTFIEVTGDVREHRAQTGNQAERILSDHVAEQASVFQISRISQNSQRSHHLGWKKVTKMEEGH
jgi:hypothetical protein